MTGGFIKTNEKFRSGLRKAIKAQGHSVNSFAKQIGMSQSKLFRMTNIQAKGRIYLDDAVAVSEELGTTVGALSGQLSKEQKKFNKDIKEVQEYMLLLAQARKKWIEILGTDENKIDELIYKLINTK